MARVCRLFRVSAGLCKRRDEAAEQPDEPNEAGASDGASRVIRVLERAEVRGLGLDRRTQCSTLYDMKTAAVTIRLEPKLEELLDRVCSDTGRSRSEVVRDALRRQLTLQLLEEARRKIIPFAEAQGIFTDEDVFKIVS